MKIQELLGAIVEGADPAEVADAVIEVDGDLDAIEFEDDPNGESEEEIDPEAAEVVDEEPPAEGEAEAEK